MTPPVPIEVDSKETNTFEATQKIAESADHNTEDSNPFHATEREIANDAPLSEGRTATLETSEDNHRWMEIMRSQSARNLQLFCAFGLRRVEDFPAEFISPKLGRQSGPIKVDVDKDKRPILGIEFCWDSRR